MQARLTIRVNERMLRERLSEMTSNLELRTSTQSADELLRLTEDVAALLRRQVSDTIQAAIYIETECGAQV